jgi:hypothetical protein
MDFPDLELDRLRKALVECKSQIEKYESILRDNDLLDSIPTVSDAEFVCRNQIAKYRLAVEKGAVLELNEVKVLDLLVKNLLLAQGKASPVVEKKVSNEKPDVAKLLKLASTKDADE